MGTTLGYKSPILDLTVKEAKDKFCLVDFITIAIKREGVTQTIIPRGDTPYKLKDQVYFSVPSYSINKLHPIIGKEHVDIKNVMILGGSSIGKKTARNLCKADFKVKLIERQWAEKDRDILGFTTEYWTVEYPDGQELFRFFKTLNKEVSNES